MSEIYWIFPFECKHGKPQREIQGKVKAKVCIVHLYVYSTLISRDKHIGSTHANSVL